MTFICEYCDNTFVSKRSLTNHIRNAKYCLSIREKNDIKSNYVCECGKSYLWSSCLSRHKKTCIPQVKSGESPIYENEQFLQFIEKMFEMATNRPTTSNTTINNTINLQPITYQYIETEGNKHLTEQIVMEGRQPEVALKVFDGHIQIADKARKKIRYKDEEGNVSTNSRKLVQEFYRAIQTKNKELSDVSYEKIRDTVNEFIAQGRVGDDDFTKLLTSGTELQDRLIAIKNLTDGIIDDSSAKLLEETIKVITS